MIEKVVENWHRHLRGEYPGGLDELLAEDVVFYSPVVFTPQKGREITKAYLNAAFNTFDGDAAKKSGDGAKKSRDGAKKSRDGAKTFAYTKKVLSGNHAMLEFETELDGTYVNGVDIISCNAEGQITEFKVMIRPLQAVNKLHAQMAAMLKKMQAG
jgi:hypothetical protein